MRSHSRLVAGVLAMLTIVAVGFAPAAAQADPLTVASASSVIGIDEQTLTPADIVAGTNLNTLRVRWVFPQDLVDGTVAVHLPLRDWQTPLHSQQWVSIVPYSAIGNGLAIVRSDSEDTNAAGSGCPWNPEDAPDVVRDSASHEWTLSVDHVTCSAGQHLDFRIINVRAPSAAGTYLVTVTDSGADSDLSGHGDAVQLPVEVEPAPTVSLRVSAPGWVALGETFPVRVTAMRDGATAVDYRGTVSLDLVDRGCADDEVRVAHEFTAADAGTATVWMSSIESHRIHARDVEQRAAPGRSNWFHVRGELDYRVCPTAYH